MCYENFYEFYWVGDSIGNCVFVYSINFQFVVLVVIKGECL